MGIRIFHGVPVYTMDQVRSVQEAVVVDGSRIVFAGEKTDAFKRYAGAERFELAHGCLMPGFIDTHLHLKDFSLLFTDLDITSLHTREEILSRIKDAVSGKKENEWVVGGGAAAAIIDGMTKDELDAVSPVNPLILHGRDLHSVLVNSAALRESGIDALRPNPLGGTIGKDKNGKLTGVLRERAVELVRRAKPEETAENVVSAVEKGMQRLLAHGITGFCDCSIHEPEPMLRTLMKVWRGGRLKLRAVGMFSDRDAYRLGMMGVQSGFGNAYLKMGGCKLIIDGSLSSRTAFMNRPYSGGESCGILLMNEQELYESLKRSCSSYLWTAVHAIGDRANEVALNSFERIGKDKGIPKLLRRIEHAQTLRDEDVGRFALLDVIAVVNPVHIPFDRENAIKYLGADARLLHRLGSLLESGAKLSIASDAPAGAVNPFSGIYAAVERKDFDDGPELRFFPREKLSLEDAVYACTMGGAKAVGLENELGSIEVGKCADFIHLSRDVFHEGTGSLKDVEVLHTWIGGEVVYEKIVDKQYMAG